MIHYFFGLKIDFNRASWCMKLKKRKNFRTYISYRQKTKDQNDLGVIDSFPLFNILFHLKVQWSNFGPLHGITLDLQNLQTKGETFFKY